MMVCIMPQRKENRRISWSRWSVYNRCRLT